ncbi:MAG: hypothetical protein Q9162_000632 [Coniocarpon cinnabarinum]
MDQPAEPITPAVSSVAREFSVLRQKLTFDIDLLHQSIKGETEITVAPLTGALKEIRLHCRQCDILSVTVEGKPANIQYNDPYRSVAPHPGWGIKQHHLYKERLGAFFGDNAREELVIELPKTVKVKESTTGGIGDGVLGRSKPGIPATPAGLPETPIVGGAELQTDYQSLSLKIRFAIKDVRDGVHFVGLSKGDSRYPCVYTLNSTFPGSACCLFPCLDDSTERSEWEISVRCAKTLGSALGLKNADPAAAVTEGLEDQSADSQKDFGLNEQERAMDLAVICSGQFEDESDDPSDETRKIVTYSTGDIYCSANQVGFAVGPFEQVDISDLREVDEDDKLAEDAVQVVAYCQPGRAAEVKNTILPLATAVDFFTERYTRFFYPCYSMCFLDDLPQDSVTTAGLSFLSTRLLFPQDIIDQIYETTHKVVHALATQYAGIGVTAREPADNWCIIGMAYFMADMFMKSLCGNNEYRFRQKLAVDRIIELDRDRPSLHSSGALLHLDPSESEFVALKSAVVLFILDRRLTKSSTSSGVSRIINRTLTATKGGDAEATLLTTGQFQKTCERTGHAKLDTFFNQWVYGAGYPIFRVNQRFNKKKLVVEMQIEQTQIPDDDKAPPPTSELNPDYFLRDVNEDLNEVYVDKAAPFKGPMTIRIHEADGTPYEHIVDIDGKKSQKLEVPYNTKYKRLKRNRRGQKDTSKNANAQNQAQVAEDKDEPLLYCLGDVLQSEKDVKDWQLWEWAPEQEKEMSEDSYEWIRMDADFEWICKLEINLQPWMFVSQLQQDRDVVAQYESLEYMAKQNAHPLISTFLTRTIMDSRYFHGIRTRAVSLLPNVAKEPVGWIGLFHLRKIFQELFCSGEYQARPNDFSDRAQYLLQLALPKALARVRDNAGQVPLNVKRLFVDTIKFNDNSQNDISDCYWITTLMSCLADVLVKSPDHPTNVLTSDSQEEEDAFRKAAIGEIERYRRIDEWISSFQNLYSRTALDCLLRLSLSDVLQPKVADFLQYTRQGNADELRLQAFRCLVDLGKLKHGPIIKYILHCMANDPSPYMRQQILSIFGRGLGLVAIGENESSKPKQDVSEGLIIEEGTTEDRAQDKARRTTIEGAIQALKAEIGESEPLADGLWTAITSPSLTLQEVWQLFSIPEILYETQDTLMVKLKYPRYYSVSYRGDGKFTFSKTRVRTEKMRVAAPVKGERPPAAARKPSMKITFPGRSASSLIDPGALTGGSSAKAPTSAQTPSLHLTMPPPAQRPTPASEKPPIKTEISPDLERRKSLGLSRPSKIVKLRVPQLKNPAVQERLAKIVPRTAPASDSQPKRIKLSVGNDIKTEESSPKKFAPIEASSPLPLQHRAGTPSDQRRPSTASSSSSKRGQKRKSSERETPVHAGGHGDYFMDANGNLAGEPQPKKSRKSGEHQRSQTPGAPSAPTASYGPVASATSPQFGAWDTPTAGASSGNASMQFGAWDSGEKPRSNEVHVNGNAERSQTPGTPVRRPSKIVKLKMPGARAEKPASHTASVSQSQMDSQKVEAPSSAPAPSSIGEPLYGSLDGTMDLAQVTAESPTLTDNTGGPSADMTAIGAGVGDAVQHHSAHINPDSTSAGAANVLNGGNAGDSDDEDDLPMALSRANGQVKQLNSGPVPGGQASNNTVILQTTTDELTTQDSNGNV